MQRCNSLIFPQSYFIFSILSLVDWSVGNNLDYNIWDKRNWMEILK